MKTGGAEPQPRGHHPCNLSTHPPSVSSQVLPTAHADSNKPGPCRSSFPLTPLPGLLQVGQCQMIHTCAAQDGAMLGLLCTHHVAIYPSFLPSLPFARLETC